MDKTMDASSCIRERAMFLLTIVFPRIVTICMLLTSHATEFLRYQRRSSFLTPPAPSALLLTGFVLVKGNIPCQSAP